MKLPMNRMTTGFLLLGLTMATPVYAAPEITIGYQGVVQAAGVILDDVDGSFKFAICDLDCVTTFWSNDGTSVEGVEPVDAVTVAIFDGVFNILLGDVSIENMQEIPDSIFKEAGDEILYLRVWFDDGFYGFEQLLPDQRLSLVPYSVKTLMTGDLLDIGSLTTTGNLEVTTTATGSSNGVVFNAKSVTGGTGVLIQAGDLDASGFAFKIEDSSRSLFYVNENGTASPRDLVLGSMTGSSELARTGAGRIFYDGVNHVFKGCNNTTCSEIGLAGPTGTADITSVGVGSGLSGGASSGDVTLSVDTSVVVTKTGNHTMTGNLTAAVLSGTTVSATTMTTTDLTATGTVTANAASVTTTTTTAGVTLPPTGTSSGSTAEIQLRELAANGSHYIGFKAPDSILLNKIWVLPASDGSAAQVLHTDGSGNLSWAADDNAGGDITAVTADNGLTGGASSGIAGLNVGVGTGIQVNADSLQFEYDNTLAGDPVLTAGQAVFDSADSQGGLLFEGATANGFEALLTATEPTADRTFTLPDATGTVALTTSNVATATALAANPSDCGANTFATTIDAGGNITCSSVGNAATTATSSNTASAIVARDASGNFNAGTITAGGATIGTSGTNITRHLSATFSVNLSAPGAVPGCVESAAQTLTGAALGNTVLGSMNVALPASYILQAYVSAADGVIFRLCQLAGAAADPDGGGGATYRADVWQH